MTDCICGVDVSAETLDARIGRDGAWQQFPRTEVGIAALADFCRLYQASLVVMEATGGYERAPFAQLWAAEIAVAIVNPRAVRRFAEAMGRLEKTDRIDCGMIAWYAETARIKPTPRPSPMQQRLAALVVHLRQLTEMKVAQTHQRRLVTEPAVLASFAVITASIVAQIRAVEREIVAMIAADPLWAALDAAFRTIKGVAGRTVARLMAHLPEIGTLDNKAASKLVGLAPLARDSGKMRGKRPVRGGRESVRTILYVVGEVVRRHEPDFMAFNAKLRAAGKPPKVARVAVAHKLLVRLNAKAREVRCRFAEASPVV